MKNLVNPMEVLLASNDSLPEELERLLNSKIIDWSDIMINKKSIILNNKTFIEIISKNQTTISFGINILEKSLTPATAREILTSLARLRLHYSSNTMSEQELSLMLEDYLNDLAPYPKDILDRACIEYRKKSDNLFFPKISQLIKLMDVHWYMRRSKLHKLEKLLQICTQQ